MEQKNDTKENNVELETLIKDRTINVKKMVRISMLSALAFGLSLLNMPLPIFPMFLKIDIADVPAVIAAITMGPVAGIVVQFVKNLLSLVVGSDSGGVGEFANFLIGSAMILPIGLIFNKKKSNKHFILGAILGVVFTTIFACVLNYFVLLPLYANLFNTTMDSFVAMGGAIIPFVDTMWEFLLFSIAPFNVFKGTIVFFISGLVYMFIKVIKI